MKLGTTISTPKNSRIAVPLHLPMLHAYLTMAVPSPLGTEPSVVVKRYTSGALAFQGLCMTICELSNFLNKYAHYALSNDLSSL